MITRVRFSKYVKGMSNKEMNDMVYTHGEYSPNYIPLFLPVDALRLGQHFFNHILYPYTFLEH